MSEVICGRSPIEIRDDAIETLYAEFGVEIEQLGITLDEMLECDHYSIIRIQKRLWKQFNINLDARQQAAERYRWRCHYSRMGVIA